jgi:hypothetical protein
MLVRGLTLKLLINMVSTEHVVLSLGALQSSPQAHVGASDYGRLNTISGEHLM